MATTVKRASICLTADTMQQIEDLGNNFGENRSQIIKRAVHFLHFYLSKGRLPSYINDFEDK